MALFKKRKIGYLAQNLRDNGIITLNDKPKDINPLFLYNPDREQYRRIWSTYDLNQCVARYVWDGLPNGLTSWNLERMLYFRGTLAGFMFAGKFYIFPYTMSGAGINPYGLPFKVRPITYNGQAVGGKESFFGQDFELPVDQYGDEADQYSAVLLYDSIPYSPGTSSPTRYALNQIIIDQMTEVLARVNINIVISNKKIMLVVKDAKQRDIVEEELRIAFGSDSPFAVLSSPLDVESVQNTSDYNADDLFNTLKNYDAIRCFMSGISSKGYGAEKKERLVTGELAGAEEEKDLILDLGLELRQLFCNQCNAKFGTNLSVRKRSDDFKDEASTEYNGNGNDARDELDEEVM